ncbi:c-type heme family protein [Gimesia panareensis]|uniref:c-type heme family protein n=1 Tax=Gimesia panareensis TaxID=2527978 RepID=UPI00118AB5FE|nr:DUF3365 domain-containing protein [Gimesia panareensis]QDU48559.1 hypothetical protein Pan110_08740 [Gimesia panareensis]
MLKMRNRGRFLLCCLLVVTCLTVVGFAGESGKKEPVCEKKVATEGTPDETQITPTISQAREQARLLHETLHSTLLIVHRKYYREDEKLPIPSSVLDDVFEDLQENRKIRFRWISVNAEAMNIDHEPKTEFEKRAAAAIADGKPEYEQVEKGIYRHVGRICLPSQCLKCHMPNRRSTATRFAGLIISLPVQETSRPKTN